MFHKAQDIERISICIVTSKKAHFIVDVPTARGTSGAARVGIDSE